MHRLTVVLVLVLAACGGASTPPVTNAGTGPAPAAETFTLKELQNGDRACYVVMTTAAGEEKSIEGDFDLCPSNSKDASKLIGKQVTYKTKKANVLAASCQGDVDCGKSDEVDLVIEISAAAP